MRLSDYNAGELHSALKMLINTYYKPQWEEMIITKIEEEVRVAVETRHIRELVRKAVDDSFEIRVKVKGDN